MSPEKKTKDSSAAKAKKVKLVRDSFCMPKDEYAQIELLKQRLLALGKAVKKSELLRAGVLALARADDDSLQAYLEAVPNLKTGRPASQPEAQVKPPQRLLPLLPHPKAKNPPHLPSGARLLCQRPPPRWRWWPSSLQLPLRSR